MARRYRAGIGPGVLRRSNDGVVMLWVQRLFRQPAQALVALFAVLILSGALLLWLPWSTEPGEHTSFLDALFTATSAVCVTGLVVVDTAAHWSAFGTAVVLVLIQLGGLGIVTFATLLALVVSDRLGIDQLRTVSAELGVRGMSDMRRLVGVVATITLASEAVVAGVLILRFWLTHELSFTDSIWHGIFHSVSAWNNAGFALYSDSLTRYVDDPVVMVTICAAIVGGGLGFPVLRELSLHRRRFARWPLHTKLTVVTTLALLAFGFMAYLVFEWDNAATMGSMPLHEKALASVASSVNPRTAGFNVIDMGQLNEPTTVVTMTLMFIGGGSASTAGGLKVTTFALLAFVMWAEVRGDRDVNAWGRRIPTTVQRQALTLALIGIGVFVSGLLALLVVDDVPIVDSAFEVLSAIGTVGLSTGVTTSFEWAGRTILVILMFLGRLGPLTLATALALRQHPVQYRYPEEQPLIG